MTAPNFQGRIAPSGGLGLRLIKRDTPSPGKELTIREIIEYGFPQKGLPDEVNDWRERNSQQTLLTARHLKMLAGRKVARAAGIPYLWSQLWLRLVKGNGQVFDLGLAGFRVVTDAGVGFIVDAFQNTVELEDMKFHGFGLNTGTSAEAAGDTALDSEFTTEYAADNTRPTGTTAEGATANIYQTVATFSPDTGGTLAVEEHGVFSQAATGGGVLLDRTVFATVNVVAGSDSLQATYELTLPSGS